jgi:hypothetical protein
MLSLLLLFSPPAVAVKKFYNEALQELATQQQEQGAAL